MRMDAEKLKLDMVKPAIIDNVICGFKTCYAGRGGLVKKVDEYFQMFIFRGIWTCVLVVSL